MTKPSTARKRTTGAAFGRLNNLQQSGQLKSIESSGEVPEPTEETSPAEAAVESPATQAPAQDTGAIAEAPATTTGQEEHPAESAEVAAGPDSQPASKAQTEPAKRQGGAVENPAVEESTALPRPQAEERAPATEKSVRDGSSSSGRKAHKRPTEPSAERKSADTPARVPHRLVPASSVGYPQPRTETLPPHLQERVRELPGEYLALAEAYRRAQTQSRPGAKLVKRNIRLSGEVSKALTQQLVRDKRQLGLRSLTASQYVDAALDLARSMDPKRLIEAADQYRHSLLGSPASGEPNHYSISTESDQWLEEMKDELLLADVRGLHGHMINVVVKYFIERLASES